MFAVEIYAAVRDFVLVKRNSRREAARVFGVSRDTIAKMCAYAPRTKAPIEQPIGSVRDSGLAPHKQYVLRARLSFA